MVCELRQVALQRVQQLHAHQVELLLHLRAPTEVRLDDIGQNSAIGAHNDILEHMEAHSGDSIGPIKCSLSNRYLGGEST